MYAAEADREANRLYIELSGRMDRSELEASAEAVLSEAEKLTEGFDLINDLSGFAPPSPEDAAVIKQAQTDLVEMGMDRVVRVTDEDTSAVVVNAFERRSRDVGYSGETADSIAAAERMLETAEVSGYADQ